MRGNKKGNGGNATFRKGGIWMEHQRRKWGPWLCGALAGMVNGLFGAGGGMVLIPSLRKWTDLGEKEIYACSVGVILPLSVVTLTVYFLRGGKIASQGLSYIIGGSLGGILAGLLFKKVKAKWLRFTLGIFILYGGIRLLTA